MNPRDYFKRLARYLRRRPSPLWYLDPEGLAFWTWLVFLLCMAFLLLE